MLGLILTIDVILQQQTTFGPRFKKYLERLMGFEGWIQNLNCYIIILEHHFTIATMSQVEESII